MRDFLLNNLSMSYYSSDPNYDTFPASMKYSLYISISFTFLVVLIQAGLTNLEVKFEEWQWEEELHVLTMEEVGLGLQIFFNIFWLFFQAGLTNLEVKFEDWQWEEELHVFTLEEVGLGRYSFFIIQHKRKEYS